MKAYTTLQEAEALVGAGLDPKTADMHYFRETLANYIHKKETGEECGYGVCLGPYDPSDEYFDTVPCWSLAALLDLIPEGVHWVLDENGLRISGLDFIAPDGHEVWLYDKLFRNPVNAIYILLKDKKI